MGVKVMGYRQSQSVWCGLTDWDWIDSSKMAYGSVVGHWLLSVEADGW